MFSLALVPFDLGRGFLENSFMYVCCIFVLLMLCWVGHCRIKFGASFVLQLLVCWTSTMFSLALVPFDLLFLTTVFIK